MAVTVLVSGRIREVRERSIMLGLKKSTPFEDYFRYAFIPISLICKTDNKLTENSEVVLTLPEWFCIKESIPYEYEEDPNG